jgi:hypothetical protein
MAAKSSGGGFGNAVRDLVRSVTGGGKTSGGGGGGRDSGQAANAPSYSGMSIKGLTSSDPANVARNQAAVKRINEAEAKRPDKKDKKDKPKPAPAPAPTPLPVAPPPTLTPPPAPLPVVPGEAPTSAVEAAAIESTQGGRQSTILTSALGLLADQEAQGQLRKRRSLMSGGMIQ